MAYGRIEYKELSKARVQDKRNIVVSSCSKGGYTLAQQLDVEEGSKITNVFMKGAIHVDDLHGLYNLRDALNVAIDAVENSSDEDWDK